MPRFASDVLPSDFMALKFCLHLLFLSCPSNLHLFSSPKQYLMVGTNFDAPHYVIFSFFCDFCVLCQNTLVRRSQFDVLSCLQVHNSNTLHEETDIDHQLHIFLTVPCRE